MLGKLAWEDEPDSSLDFPRGDSWLLVVAGQAGSLCGNLFEDVVDERVQNRHGFARDASVRVDLRTSSQRSARLAASNGCFAPVLSSNYQFAPHLLEDLIDVDLVGLDGLLLLALPLAAIDRLGDLLGRLLLGLGCHVAEFY